MMIQLFQTGRSSFLLATVVWSLLPSRVIAFQPPPPPDPPPPLADCPIDEIGQFGGFYEYETVDCSDASITGFGHSAEQIAMLGCGPQGECYTPIAPIVSALAASKPEKYKAESLSDAIEIVEAGQYSLAAFETYYSAAGGPRVRWMRKLKGYRTVWLKYLKNHPDSEGDKLETFNDKYDYLETGETVGRVSFADQAAQGKWAKLGVDHESPWERIRSDVKRQESTVGVGALKLHNGWEEDYSFYLKVDRGDSGLLYFRFVNLKKGARTRRLALQLETKPQHVTTYAATFAERGRYTHILIPSFAAKSPVEATTFEQI